MRALFVDIAFSQRKRLIVCSYLSSNLKHRKGFGGYLGPAKTNCEHKPIYSNYMLILYNELISKQYNSQYTIAKQHNELEQCF